MLVKNAGKPLVILLFFMAAVCLYFWLTSRYPELVAKSILGSSSILSSLGFHPLVEIKKDFTFWEKILWETVNWLNTNKKGMSFSFIAGAFFMSLWPLFHKRNFNNGFQNSLFGMVIGAPLGVCVNCAAPIAKAIYSGGGSVQTTLSALLASPTLNIIVIVMAFGFFPFYLVATKLALTFLFILVLIPLSCRFLFQRETIAPPVSNASAPEVQNCILNDIDSWKTAFFWSIKTYFKNLFYLLKIALPLMFLAGFLGALITVIMPWSEIENLGQEENSATIFIVMLAISIFGAFLPSPMAFDIILSSALLQAGVPIHYVAVFLFTLGSFSIYAFFIIWQSISLRIAAFLFLSTVILGVVCGVTALFFEQHTINKTQTEIMRLKQISPDDGSYDPIMQRQDKALPYRVLRKTLNTQTATFTAVPNDVLTQSPSGITLEWRSYEKTADRITPDTKAFSFTKGYDLGIEQPYVISYITGIPDAISYATTSVATGDVHNDGWPDILIAGDLEVRPNLILYSNIAGKSFKRQTLPLSDDAQSNDAQEVILVALADLNGDSWKDIVFTTRDGKNFVIYNREGDFTHDNLASLGPKIEGTTMALAFGDIEKDGDLDVFLGNWSVGPSFSNFKKSRNILLVSKNDNTFETKNLPGITGETTTGLFSDFNQDGWPDLYIGNDYIRGQHSDILLTGGARGVFKIADKALRETVSGGASTMSIDIGDIDNDLKPDYYIGQVAYTGHYFKSMSKIADKQIPYSQYCTRHFENDTEIEKCNREMTLKLSLAKGAHYISDSCDAVKDADDKAKCLLHMSSFRSSCSYHASSYWADDKDIYDEAGPRYRAFCALQAEAEQEYGDPVQSNPVETCNTGPTPCLKASNESLHNVLLHNLSDNQGTRFADEANARNTGYGAWTWNARFGDLDNDGWQDLYIVNGYTLPLSLATNLFYRNDGDGVFKDKTDAFGLESYIPTSTFSFFDMDNDGDLDIVTVPTDAPVQVYKNNNLSQNNSVQFSLFDQKTKNTSALGAKITIHYTNDKRNMQQIGFIKGGGGFKSYNQPIAHFGLGQATHIKIIEIEWPDGSHDTIKGKLPVNKRYRITRSAAQQ